MKEIPLTQGKTAKVDDADYECVSAYKWHAAKNRHVWYARRNKDGRPVSMHREILSYSGKNPIDHINGDGLDNRRSNLRIATHSLNQINRKYRTPSASKYRGVSYCKRDKAWFAGITHEGSYKYLGYFKNELDAAVAYNIAAKRLYGKDAQLNALKEKKP